MSSQSEIRYVVVSGLQEATTKEDIVQYFESQEWQGCKVVYVIYIGLHKAKAKVAIQGDTPETIHDLSCNIHIHGTKVKIEFTDTPPTPEQIKSAVYSATPISVTSATASQGSKEVTSVTSDQISPPRLSVDVDKLSSSTAESEQLKKNSSVEKIHCSEFSHSPETLSKTTEGPCVQPVQLAGVKEQDSWEACDSHYIIVSGLPSSISIEKLVAYFQSARCGGGTVTKVVYLDTKNSMMIVGFSDIALTSSHKLFKGIHRIEGTRVTVKATDTALTLEQKQSAVYSYDPKAASTASGQVKSPSERTTQKDMPTHLEHDQTKVSFSPNACKQETLPTSNSTKYFDGSSQHDTSYITVSGLTQSISVEDIVAYFQSARCGGGTVTEVAYVDQSKSVAFVGISGPKLNSAHKMFKGIHRMCKTKVKVDFTDTSPNSEQQMTIVYSFNVPQGSTEVSRRAEDQSKLHSVNTTALRTLVDPKHNQAHIDGKHPLPPTQTDGKHPLPPIQTDGKQPLPPIQTDGKHPLPPIQTDGKQPFTSMQTDGEQPLLPITDGEQSLLPMQTPSPQKLSEVSPTSYITVSGLSSSISVEDIVAYFQSARCGGGTVAEVVYQDHSKTQAFVGIGKVELNTSHKLFKGKHMLNQRQLNVHLASNSPPPTKNSALVAYVHKETNPIEDTLPNSSTTHANVMADPNAPTPKTVSVQDTPINMQHRSPFQKYLHASQCQDIVPHLRGANKHSSSLTSSLHASYMSDTQTRSHVDISEETVIVPKGMGADLHAAIAAHNLPTDVTITLSSKGNVVLRGRKKEVENLRIEVERMIHEKTEANDNAVTVRDQSLLPRVLVYLEKCVRERLMSTYNIQFKTDIQTNTLEVSGTSASCTRFMNEVQSLNPPYAEVALPLEGVSLLVSPQGMALISNVIGQRPIGHFFTSPDDSVACSVAAVSKLYLVAENHQYLVEIAQQLQNSILVFMYPVPKHFFNLLSSSSWINTCKHLEANFAAQLSPSVDKGIVTIACNKQHLEIVKKGLHDFCERECSCEEILPLQKGEWEHLQHCRDWTDILAKMKSSGLQVRTPSPWDQTPSISFHGEFVAVKCYTERTKEIRKKIARQRRDTSGPANTQPSISISGRQPGMGSTNHNTADHPTTLDKQSRDKSDPEHYSAYPILNTGTIGQNSSNVHPSTDDTLAAKPMDVASIIQIKRGGLTDYQADVYVNTTNTTLSLKLGAVAQSLLKAGGPALQAECNQYIAQHGNIPDWGYAITRGGNLKCKHVIHAVSASYGGQRRSALSEQAMKTMVANIMAECDRLQVSSVAFPAIGTGVLGFPDDIVAKVMLQAIASYLLSSHPLSALKRVFLVIFSDKAYKAFQSQLQTTLSTGCTQGGTSQLQSSTQPSHPTPSHAVGNPPLQPIYHGAHSSTAYTQSQSATLQSFMTHNVTIDIILGDITSEDCDGLVSTSSPDLTLHPVGVMGALLKKGGTELQQECTAAVRQYGRLTSSKVIVTGAGRPGGLKCRKILHILAPNEAYDLQKVVKAVLREADKERLSVVSLPAIGTGQHGFTPEESAKGICEAIVEFSKSQPNHVKHVKVVLFQEEHYSSFSTAFTAASSKKGLSSLRKTLSHVRSAITPGHRSTNSETSVVHRPPHTFPSHTKPQQTGHTQYAARNPADSKYTSSFTEDFRSPNFVYESTEEDKPSTWDPMPTDPLTGKENTHHLVDLPPHSGEYKEVSQAFHQTISYYKIKKIQRIQNPKLWSQYAARKKTMDRESPQGTQNERKLFHGCTEGVMQSINHSGFNASNVGRKASTYGKGMYFSRDASSSTVYAALCQGSRHMYLARVLTGEFTNGNYTTSIPPPKNLSNPNVLFDSVVDNIHYPCVFVVFFEDQAYPEYLITYGS